MNVEPRQTIIRRFGGKGSGNIGHAGRPGLVGGSSSGIGGGFSLATKNAKEFNSAIDNAYKGQKVKDWQADYIESLPLKGYFGTSQAFAINRSLRDGVSMDARAKDAMKAVENGFKNNAITLGEGTVLHRAVSGKFAEQLQNMKAGDSFVDKGYMSTAGTKAATKRFGNVRMEITPTKGLKALIFRDETEVLLQPGRKTTIGKIRKVGNQIVISVVVS